MKASKYKIYCALALIIFFAVLMFRSAESFVVNEGTRVYLVDRHGERWDITKAKSIGFEPGRFEFGIGRNAFRPLSDNDWSHDDKKTN